jgi:hypothetical protein
MGVSTTAQVALATAVIGLLTSLVNGVAVLRSLRQGARTRSAILANEQQAFDTAQNSVRVLSDVLFSVRDLANSVERSYSSLDTRMSELVTLVAGLVRPPGTAP